VAVPGNKETARKKKASAPGSESGEGPSAKSGVAAGTSSSELAVGAADLWSSKRSAGGSASCGSSSFFLGASPDWFPAVDSRTKGLYGVLRWGSGDRSTPQL